MSIPKIWFHMYSHIFTDIHTSEWGLCARMLYFFPGCVWKKVRGEYPFPLGPDPTRPDRRLRTQPISKKCRFGDVGGVRSGPGILNDFESMYKTCRRILVRVQSNPSASMDSEGVLKHIYSMSKISNRSTHTFHPHPQMQGGLGMHTHSHKFTYIQTYFSICE